MKTQKVFSLSNLTMREIILARLKRLGVSRYDLALFGGCDAAPSTIYRFLSGNRSTFSGNIEQVIHACGLRLVEEKQAPKWAKECIARNAE